MQKFADLFRGWLNAQRFNRMRVEAQIRLHRAGHATPSRSGRLCIFSHYDPDGIVDAYVSHYLKEIRKLDADIVFVSTAPSLANTEIARISPLCRDIYLRTNISADFGSWNLGIRLLGDDGPAFRQLILANDSVYGPFVGLAPIFAQMEARDLDLWGLTESYEDARHVQSYFLVFEQRALESAFFKTFWNSFRQEWDKRRLVLTNEIGISQTAWAEGLRCDSWISSEEVGARTNPTLFFWDRLIEDLKFPFLKTEILKLNRFQSVRASDWRQIIEAKYPEYASGLIAAHLRRVGTAVAAA